VPSSPPAPRTLAADRAAGVSTVPATALRFAEVPFQLAAGEAKDGKTPIEMRARSGQPVNHWYWGKIVHDMAGFKAAKPTIPVDYCHNDREVLGFLNQFKASNEGLDVAGELVSFQPTDRVAEVTHKSRAGIPYEASIFFDRESMTLEEVGPMAQATVNGYQLQGPALIVRQWSLRGVAVCPYGYDGNTATKLSAADEADVPVQFVSSSEPVMDGQAKPADTKPADTKPAELATKPAEGPFDADPLTKFRAELTKFTDAFGAENGLKWFNEGCEFSAAQAKHTEALTSQHASQLKAKDATIAAQLAEIDGLKQKLSAVPRGEAEPVSFAAGDKHEGAAAGVDPSALKFKLGDNLAKVAAGIKLPGKK
jgi:hypothetical protein